MDAETKEFFKLQYQWKRLPHPSRRVMYDKRHPLHVIELEISHSIHLIDDVINVILGDPREIKNLNIARILQIFIQIRFKLDSFEYGLQVQHYMDFVEKTLALLYKADLIVSHQERG